MNVLMFMHDFFNKKLPKSFDNYFRILNSTIELRRNVNNVYLDKPRTNFSARLPKHNFGQIWNKYNKEYRNISSRSLFKNTIKKTFLNDYSCNIYCMNMYCTQCHPGNNP